MDRASLNRTSSGYSSLKQASSRDYAASLSDSPMASSKRITPFLLYLVFIVTLGPLQFGYHLGELNAPQKVITCQVDKQPSYGVFRLPECIPMSGGQWGLVQSAFTIGGLLGALFSGFIATKFGRLFALKWLTFFLAMGPIAEALAGKMWVLAMGRAISGLGAGAATVVCPIYISEVAPREQRGLFGAFTQVQINFGIFIAQLLGYFLSKNTKWRWILATAGFIAAGTFVGLMLAPETPKWLAGHNRPRMARGILQRIRGKGVEIREEMEHWEVSGEAEEESLLGPPRGPRPQPKASKSILDVIRVRKYRRAVIAVTGTMMAQQLCGINAVVMYSVAILGSIMPKQAALITVIVSAANVLVTLLSSPLPDRIGRKACLLVSISGMGSASVMLAIGLEKDIRLLTIIGIGFFVCSFGVGLGPVPFLLPSELVGPEAVGATSSWALAGNWLSTFMVAQFFPLLNAALPHGRVWWIFAAIAAAFGAFVGILVPESKGKATPGEVWGRSQS
ncbi:Bifunctional purine biosynthesis protein PurH [Exophiala xenobiotica]|uniref:Bifunctional purine biosynthesis protein PurH n=1 Tax=Vermiconidia calcicola TaxID=1690605 RepID=A0AAV9QGS5_9PEZI|nr:Bifunctional purine biosynthesis protein PurH [Exophiala xenobiotica]KAK5542398.1 Bifunctional purine biosynthesis protein PurH [Vermiconidia calcicola]KAK5546256.1 Bifunctional purine biosynthesis protein PurH [Chaetothyriales sp. CCFEE 6169]KAK5195740.1 Bifunctional purine biosynthesis protein PurH [Exophiala xenobiotica]KAK5210084.1 Bifunctional purine biosynthesis protein PurH [Exophiala xenobiotica]